MMNDFATTMLFISSEIALALGIIVVIIFIVTLKRRKKKEGVARDLIRNYKAGAAEKRETLRLLLKEVFQMDDENADLNTETLSKAEKQLFTHILKIYLGKDTECIHEIESDIHTLVQGYHAIASSHGGNSHASSDNSDNSEAEDLRSRISVLKAEKERLQDELKIALETIDNIMKEYATMFSGGGDFDRQDPNNLKKLQETASTVDSIKESLEEDLKQPDENETNDTTPTDESTDETDTALNEEIAPQETEPDDTSEKISTGTQETLVADDTHDSLQKDIDDTENDTQDPNNKETSELVAGDISDEEGAPGFDEAVVPDIDLESNLSPENFPDEKEDPESKS